MIQFLRPRKRNRQATVGIAFGADGVAAARVHSGGRDSAPHADAAAWLPAADAQGLARRLDDWVDERGLARSQTVGVVAPADYKVLQIEAPNVPAAEMNQAAAWHVRDLIDMPVDQAIIDTFDPPESAQRGGRQINVVVARRSVIDERAEMIRDAGLQLAALDVPELVQRNICMRLPAARGGHALLALDVAGGLLTVFRDGELFLARNLDTGQTALANDDEASIDALVLEVQRSFDYFESALSQAPLGALYVYPALAGTERVAAAVTDSIGNIECRCVALGEIVRFDDAADGAGDRAPVLHAVGAALRRQGATP